MRFIFRFMTACLLGCLLSPQLTQAGGDLGKDPYEIGEKYYARKDYRTALKLYRKALERHDPRAHYRLGQIYEATGKDKDALNHYQRSLELDQPDTQRSDTDRRVKAIAARQKPTRKATPPTGLLERGKSLFKSGKYREAEQVLLQAAAKDASKPETHFFLGEVYLALGEYDKAKSEYDKAKGYY